MSHHGAEFDENILQRINLEDELLYLCPVCEDFSNEEKYEVDIGCLNLDNWILIQFILLCRFFATWKTSIMTSGWRFVPSSYSSLMTRMRFLLTMDRVSS